MPHDRDVVELSIGDTVWVPCHVKEIHLMADYCNVALETAQEMYPSHLRSTLVLNSRQTVKHHPAEAKLAAAKARVRELEQELLRAIQLNVECAEHCPMEGEDTSVADAVGRMKARLAAAEARVTWADRLFRKYLPQQRSPVKDDIEVWLAAEPNE